jgi:hypothetical protein
MELKLKRHKINSVLQLFIKKELIEEVTLQLNGKTIEQREAEVNDARDFLKYKYRQSLFIHPDWEIRIDGLQSKMNATK